MLTFGRIVAQARFQDNKMFIGLFGLPVCWVEGKIIGDKMIKEQRIEVNWNETAIRGQMKTRG